MLPGIVQCPVCFLHGHALRSTSNATLLNKLLQTESMVLSFVAEFGKRMERDRCWCQNGRCRAITCEGSPQQGEHSCFTQVKLKSRADGSKYIKVKRGCTANCKAYSTAEVVQQCCNSTLCNTGPLNVTHDNRTIISVEQLPKKNDSTSQFVNLSDVAKIFSDIPTFPTTTSAAPTTSGKDSEYPSLHSMSATLVLQLHAHAVACTRTSMLLAAITSATFHVSLLLALG